MHILVIQFTVSFYSNNPCNKSFFFKFFCCKIFNKLIYFLMYGELIKLFEIIFKEKKIKYEFKLTTVHINIM